MTIKEAINKVVQNHALSRKEMTSVMHDIMSGKCSPAQIGAFLTSMRMKGESVDEVTGAATVLRKMSTKVQIAADHLVDIVGTGGDEAHLFNVSTASAFVAAASGACVAKHGNRGVSSSSGSADVLEKAGINLSIAPEQVAQCVEALGVGFMFAPMHHSAMKNVASVRRELGMRTIFNILGPMSNPANVDNLVIGVYKKALCRPISEVLRELGRRHVMVVHSNDGLDEISIAESTFVVELKEGQIREYAIQPEDFGIAVQSLTGLSVEDSVSSLALILDALGIREGAYAGKAADMIALNAGAAIYVSGVADSLDQGVALAQKTIASGLAREKLQQLVHFTQSLVDNKR